MQISIGASSGAPIRLAYAEARRFLGPAGDTGFSSQGRNDDPSSRVDQFAVGPGVYTLSGVRGSQRYIRIELADAGSASIDFIRVEVNHLRPRPATTSARFLSSDDLLNRIWYAGAYT